MRKRVREIEFDVNAYILLIQKNRSLRDSGELMNPPTMEAISDMLQFLASPLVGCVEKTKDGYYATGSLSDAARKLAFYTRNCFEEQKET